jgi:nitric oxide reductase large subunit
VSGIEPPGQRLGVNVLFVALLVIVVGSLTGEWHERSTTALRHSAFYFGHQGYEYVDLGRAWQLGPVRGLLIWLTLVLRATLAGLQESGRATAPVGPVSRVVGSHWPVLRGRPDVGHHTTSQWSNTGGGGSFICGLRLL